MTFALIQTSEIIKEIILVENVIYEGTGND